MKNVFSGVAKHAPLNFLGSFRSLYVIAGTMPCAARLAVNA
jgi:hypothetical protein